MKWIPKLLSLIFLWGSIAMIIINIEPRLIRDVWIPGAYLPFLIVLTITVWYTILLIVKSVWGSLILTTTIVGGVILSMLQLMHIGLVIALLLTFIIESWYIYHRHEKIRTKHEQKNRDTGI